jgi:hypothetical protein
MSKVIKLDEKQLFFDFYNEIISDAFNKSFLESRLGMIYQSFPWQEFESFYTKKFNSQKIKQGRKRKFPIRAELGLLVLMAITGLSDRELFERFRTDISFQRFCEVVFISSEKENNYKILSAIRARYVDFFAMFELQELISSKWSDYLKEIDGVIMDATVFQSNIRYPVDYHILEDSLDWLYRTDINLSKILQIRRMRSNYKSLRQFYKRVSIQRQPRVSLRNRLKRRQLRLIKKFISRIEYLFSLSEKNSIKLNRSLTERFSVIREVYECYSNSECPNKERILNLRRSYVRAIYRGKSRSKWEFGQKWHMFMLGDMVFVDKVSSENYNESERLMSVVERSNALTGNKIRLLGADRLYWTNSNRRFCSSEKIFTNFVHKGRQGKYTGSYKSAKALINGHRSSRMEGIFGVLKSYYNTERIRYFGKQKERLMVFLSVVSHNSLIMSKFLEEKEEFKKVI